MSHHDSNHHDATTPLRYDQTPCTGLLRDGLSRSAQHPRKPWTGMLWLASSVLLAAACTQGSENSEHDQDSATSIASSDGDEKTASESHAPVIEQLTVAPSALTPWDTVTVTAVVSDPDGLDDIQAGLVFHNSTGAVHRSFIEVDAGVYEAEFTWSRLNTADPIDFTISEQRQFLVEFFDHSGLVGSAVFDLQLHCYGIAACGGVCSDLDEPDHCGACGVECEGACVEGQCAAAK